MLAVGQRMGQFDIERELGSGAMGTVYKVKYVPDGRTMALKVIAFGLTGNETAIRRFEREAEILKQLKHPNIVRLFATGRYKGTPFFAMEYVEGESLDYVLARRVRFSWEEVVQIGIQTCGALQHAHDKGIIHRDLKPSNLMRLHDGTIKLTDFGIAKDMDVTALTGANCTVGTASYMSPEQCKGETVTSKSDLYSLGVVLFELLTGRKPFLAESPIEMFTKHVNEPPPRPNWSLKGSATGEIPTWLETTVLQLMEKKAEHRPLSAAMVAESLQEGLQKYYSGQSAAVEAVQARAIDRRIQTNVVDETDREAARTLRGALQKKKIKKKTTPFYRKGWFVVLLIPPFILAFVGILWFASRPPSAESLYRQAQARMEKGEYRDALYDLAGRDGPIRKFLLYHPEHELAPQVRRWQDEAETGDLLDKLTHNAGDPKFRKQYFDKVDPNYELLAFQAIRFEKYGDIMGADDRWQKAFAIANTDPEQRVAKRLCELRVERLVEQWNAEKEKSPENYKNGKVYRIALLERNLATAKQLKAESKLKDLRELAEETRSLYADEDDKELRELASQIYEVFKPSSSDEKKSKDETKESK